MDLGFRIILGIGMLLTIYATIRSYLFWKNTSFPFNVQMETASVFLIGMMLTLICEALYAGFLIVVFGIPS